MWLYNQILVKHKVHLQGILQPQPLSFELSHATFYIGWAGSRKHINPLGNLVKYPQSHGSFLGFFEKSTAAGVLGEWLSANSASGAS